MSNSGRLCNIAGDREDGLSAALNPFNPLTGFKTSLFATLAKQEAQSRRPCESCARWPSWPRFGRFGRVQPTSVPSFILSAVTYVTWIETLTRSRSGALGTPCSTSQMFTRGDGTPKFSIELLRLEDTT